MSWMLLGQTSTVILAFINKCMDEQKAKKIGSNVAIKAVTAGLLVAQLIMTFLSSDGGFIKGFFWFTHFSYNLNLVIGILVMYLCGYFLGQRAGLEIIVKKKDFYWTGLKYGFLTLFATAFISSWTGFFQEGMHNMGTQDEPINDYIVKPVFWIMTFGFIPLLLIGYLFGRQIKKMGQKLTGGQ